MSNSSAKPSGPADRYSRASSWDAEPSDPEHHRAEGEDARSPYAPKRTRTSLVPPPRSNDEDVPPPPRFLLSRDEPNKERGLTDFPQSSLQFQAEPKPAEAPREQPRPSLEAELRRALSNSSPAEPQPVEPQSAERRPERDRPVMETLGR